MLVNLLADLFGAGAGKRDGIVVLSLNPVCHER